MPKNVNRKRDRFPSWGKAYARKAMRQWRATQTAAGRCNHCIAPAIPGKAFCEKHQRALIDYQFRRRYGIGLDERDQLIEAQGGGCAICGRTEDSLPFGMRLSRGLTVDHDHETGLVRGMLCMECNKGIGQLGDSIDRLRAAIEYLERSRPREKAS